MVQSESTPVGEAGLPTVVLQGNLREAGDAGPQTRIGSAGVHTTAEARENIYLMR
jgi:hypothetical protein